LLAINLIDAVEKDHESTKTKRTASPRFFSSLLELVLLLALLVVSQRLSC
jgi:hypothetical protein